MRGAKARALAALAEQAERTVSVPAACPLCGRAIPADQRDAHHLVPKSKGGRHTIDLHRICHRQIHAVLTETELARSYHSVEQLLAHPALRSFVDWVRTKPDDFFVRTRKSDRVRRR
ncbi:HNH endonuclease [Hydrogenophaga sp. IBVHS2]|uniref:HNH endonuclease n=1 Tax=Hydrogenophaga sp. IBVHS2 TaxID=1985170 RepID=UPI00211A1313|nr:HNH endonuclease signature motif containing protein [Hydrogenophaga sp. IBVHS2]